MNAKGNIVTTLIFVFVAACALSGCAGSQGNGSSKPVVAVSIVPQETFLTVVAGERVEVVTMIPPGNSPANYQPSPKEMQAFSRASLYFALGVPAENANIVPKAKDFNSDLRIVDLAHEVGEVYPHRFFQQDGKETGRRDPHIWLSPKRVRVMVNVIAEELGNLDPANKNIYEKNAEEYIAKLDSLDKNITNSLKGVQKRTFIMYHPALGYFADDYNLEMVTVEKEGKEASAKRLQEIVDIAERKGIDVVFFQEEMDSAQTRTIAAEIEGEARKLDPLAADYIDNMMGICAAIRNSLE